MRHIRASITRVFTAGRIFISGRIFIAGLVIAVTGIAFNPVAAQAQAWPTAQPIRVVVPFTAGSGTDLVARAVFDQVATQLGQTIVIDNRAGAGGTLGVNAVAKAAPDGYTLLAHSSSHTVSAVTFSQLPYDTVKDLKAIIPLANLPNVLVVATAKGYKTARDMVDAAKAKPGTFNYTTPARAPRRTSTPNVSSRRRSSKPRTCRSRAVPKRCARSWRSARISTSCRICRPRDWSRPDNCRCWR